MYNRSNLGELLALKSVTPEIWAGKKVVVRAALNVATSKDGQQITDATRLEEALPLLKSLGETAERVVILAHLGRPTLAREPEFSLEVVRKALEQGLGQPVQMLTDEQAIADLGAGKLGQQKFYLLENVRFFAGEDAKDAAARQEFAKQLAGTGDIYVNDAFADYRDSASTYDIAKLLPSYLGPVFVKEVAEVTKLANPARPFVAVLGGAKLSEKLDALLALGKDADKILVGGAMAYTLLKAKGIEVGKSLVEADKLDVAKQALEQFGNKLVLPVDHVVVPEFKAEATTTVTDSQEIPADQIAVDIGPKTIAAFEQEIAQAKSLLWNGPMGVFEWDSAAAGTQAVGKAISNSAAGFKFAGGGDSIAAINKFGLAGFSHVSTGGGAMLAMLAYDKFPTLDVILEIGGN
jgi:phosphoglycerate kinase